MLARRASAILVALAVLSGTATAKEWTKLRLGITGGCWEEHRYTVQHGSARPKAVKLASRGMTYKERATEMIAEFVGAIAGGNQPFVSGRDVLPSIQAISEGYRCARSYDEPWLPRFGK